MQEICSLNPPMVTGICDSNNSRVQHHRRSNMCVGCFEISIGIIRAFCLSGGGRLVKNCSVWGTEEIAGLWFARGDQCPG